MTVRAISLWQPWASLWLSSAKVHETRHWPCKHRGPLLVHAAKRINLDLDGRLDEIVNGEFGHHWGIELPRGALIGKVEIVACHRIEDDATAAVMAASDDDLICGNWTPGRYVWRRAPVFSAFVNPIPYKGRQGFFSVPDDLLKDAA